jgi:hypothetical protein
MTSEGLKQHYGDEYPSAVKIDGMRLPLRAERRFSRYYHSPELKYGCAVSRFMDGSASITAPELQGEWHKWTHAERLDFCQNCSGLHHEPDFSDMLRFIMEHGGPSDWSAIALSVAGILPQPEAFDLLVRAFHSFEPGKGSNIGQAIAYTKDPRAEKILRERLDALWRHDQIWEDAEFTNWIAYEAMTTITHLLELGADKNHFKSKAGQLAQHRCAGTRDSSRRLAKHYPELA